jgi:glycosyltransferase involved in cell wall biosynthesis
MSKPKVLIVIDWFLPGTKSGGPVRSYANMIAHLKSEFDFYVLTRDKDYCEDKPYQSVTSNAWNSLEAGLQVYYLSKAQTTYTGMKQVFKSRHFDVVLVNGMYSWYFSILPLWLLRQHSKVIVSARGMLNAQAFSVKPVKKILFLKLAKLMGLYSKVLFHATNAAEAQQIYKWIGAKATVMIAPNLPRKITSERSLKPIASPVRLVNMARISKEKGTLRLLEVLKQVTHPLSLDLYGSVYDENYWTACQEAIKDLPAHIRVTYKGVAESSKVPDILRGYHFFVMLSEGENFGHAILEALSVGLPVIISNNTPWRNLAEKQVGWDLELADTQAIVEVLNAVALMDEASYATYSKAAYKLAQVFINDKAVIEANKRLFLQ